MSFAPTARPVRLFRGVSLSAAAAAHRKVEVSQKLLARPRAEPGKAGADAQHRKRQAPDSALGLLLDLDPYFTAAVKDVDVVVLDRERGAANGTGQPSQELRASAAHLAADDRILGHSGRSSLLQPPAIGGHSASASPSLRTRRERCDGATYTPLTSTRCTRPVGRWKPSITDCTSLPSGTSIRSWR